MNLKVKIIDYYQNVKNQSSNLKYSILLNGYVSTYFITKMSALLLTILYSYMKYIKLFIYYLQYFSLQHRYQIYYYNLHMDYN